MDMLMQIGISAVLALLLSLMTYKCGLLTKSGCVSAAAIGMGIGVFGSLNWLILLIVFALLGFAATIAGFSKKRKMGVQEGEHGERGAMNILGVAIPPLIIALMNFFIPGHYDVFSMAYIATIAVAAADTAASEIGVKDPKVWMITTLKRTEPGVDGGVSVKGTLISLVGSAVVSVIGALVIFYTMDIYVLVPVVCGFLGCLLDSVIGATVETWGYVSKYGNNCITGIAGGLLTVLILMLVGDQQGLPFNSWITSSKVALNILLTSMHSPMSASISEGDVVMTLYIMPFSSILMEKNGIFSIMR